ncbi:Txe/YoeB family addiction module toxin [Pararhizobium sp. YC-54]|uniref:Txe/YoeB family addiction module toxin n=1 Tax=Pararhizobium sp. YC-54 TaxID=2986920 RepID=UPI0021F770FF|nr:Txe/YoeB family addiction module toxin [Pararhizobium sp. YC-54]MCV9997463.1 Txe/YoeB family addiction module toxin [Pararhizobium sp. YC-54]
MKIQFSQDAWEDLQYWITTDTKTLQKILNLLKACQRTPFSGTGKPEPLRNELKGWLSRRITQEHRLVYRVSGTGENQALEVAACRSHYS